MDVDGLLNDIRIVRTKGVRKANLEDLPALAIALALHRPDRDDSDRKHHLEEFLAEAANQLEDRDAQGIRLALGIGPLGRESSADRRADFAAYFDSAPETVRRRDNLEDQAFTRLAKAILRSSLGLSGGHGSNLPDPATADCGSTPWRAIKEPSSATRVAAADPPGNRHAETPLARALPPLSLESAVAEAADRVPTPADLRVVTTRIDSFDPTRFLSGASLNGADVARYAVARRVDMDGDELAVDDVAARISAEDTVGYLIAGAGEGKSTYLHALCSSLMSRAIVFRWKVAGQLDWSKLQQFRDEVASASPAVSSDEPTIAIIGELDVKLTREQEDSLIQIVQGIRSGLAPPRTSIVLAGRPAWLNRIRQRVSTGQTMRLVPLSGAEAELLIENLADAHGACYQDKGTAWTDARFPNLGQFLALPRASRVKIFLAAPSLVGSLLRAVYGREFIRRLIAEYNDLEPAERAAYLLVSLATSSLGGISEELLESICPDADIECSSAGSPWQRDIGGMHSARHEMIGRLVVEDKGASTAREISQIIGRIVAAAADSSPEARDLLLKSVRIFDESRSLVPDQQRKTEPQFRAAVRSGILANRESWERLEQVIGPGPSELLAYSYVLYRLLGEKRGLEAEYLLARSEHLLALAESAATPGSPFAYRARYHRIIVAREARRIHGDVVDDPSDIAALIPMMSHSWPEPTFYAHVLSLGVSTLRNCDLGEDESDLVVGAVLEAWQRLRVEGDERKKEYEYSTLEQYLYDWPPSRLLSLRETAWEFSRALANPDGSLACLIDTELSKREKSSTGEVTAALRARRQHFLSQSVVAGQSDAEVVLRFAELAGTDVETARHAVLQVAGQLAVSEDPSTRSMALHALARVATSADERLNYLRGALPAYEESTTSRVEWFARNDYWKRALRTLRAIAPDEASALELRLAAAGRRFGT